MNEELLHDLLDRMGRGDPGAAGQLFRLYEPYLRVVVRRLLPRRLRSKCDSADVVQSVWVHLLRGWPGAGWRFATAARLRAFLATVARRRVSDRLRRYHLALLRELAWEETPSEDVSPSTQPPPSDLAQADDLWRKMLDLCPPVHHDVLRLKRLGLPLAEIARRTGMHEGSVRRILRQLARQLACSADNGTIEVTS